MELARALCSICQQHGCNDFILDSKVAKATGLSCIVTYGVKNQHVSGMQSPLIKCVLFTGDITNSESEWIIHIRLCHNDGSHFQHAWTRCSYAGSSPLLCTLWTCTLLFFADTFSVLKLWALCGCWTGANCWCPWARFVFRSSSELLHDVDTPTICGWNSGG